MLDQRQIQMSESSEEWSKTQVKPTISAEEGQILRMQVVQEDVRLVAH